jgi:hypothetical protein
MISGSIVSSNTASSPNNVTAAGIEIRNSHGANSISDSTIEMNQANSGCGGAFFTGSTVSVDNCLIRNNAGLGSNGGFMGGGGLGIRDSEVEVRNTLVSENLTNGMEGGGGIRVTDCPDVRFVNCAVYGNTAGGWDGGGAMKIDELSTVEITNCSISGNRTVDPNPFMDAGALLISVSTVTASNSVVWGNTPAEAVLVGPGSVVDVSYCDLEGGAPTGGGDITVTEILELDPRFVLPWNGGRADLRLRSDSPCIDRGTSAGAPSDDIVGVARPVGAGVDLGAYEGGVELPAGVAAWALYD